MKLKFALLALVLASTAAVAVAQTPLPPADPLDDRSAKRIERMEKVVRELRAIVFQGRDTGKPVVVQPGSMKPLPMKKSSKDAASNTPKSP